MSAAVPQPDFLRPVARPGWLAWAWCGTGLLVLAVSAADSHAAWQARQQALDLLARSQPGAVRPGAVPAGPTQAANLRSAAQARQAEAARWQQQLALPWPVVWAASETPPGGVQWLLIDQGSGGLRLAGLAGDLAAAEATADAVRQQQQGGSPAWQDVALAAVDRTPGGLRFELVARLAGPATAAGSGPVPSGGPAP